MTKFNDLAAIINSVDDNDLAAVSPDDLLAVLEGLGQQPQSAAVIAARGKLAAAILRNTDRKGKLAARSRRVH